MRKVGIVMSGHGNMRQERLRPVNVMGSVKRVGFGKVVYSQDAICDKKFVGISGPEKMDLNLIAMVPRGKDELVKVPTVFVCYRDRDFKCAEGVAEKIADSGMVVYLEKVYKNTFGYGALFGDYFSHKISGCDGLLMVVPGWDEKSFWESFAIGVARGRNKKIGTYLVNLENKGELPFYFWNWPVLGNDEDISVWCQYFKESASDMEFFDQLKKDMGRLFK